MAAHVLSEEDAQSLFAELNENDYNANLEECFGQINQQLSKGFGLEIATFVLGKLKYHAVINSHADDIAKQSFQQHFNPHERAIIQLMMQKLVDDTKVPRKDLINLRSKLEEPYKLTHDGAGHVVEVLLEEGWLQVSQDELADKRRESLQISLEIAPRTYLELSHLLVEMGIPQEDLPQFLFHRF